MSQLNEDTKHFIFKLYRDIHDVLDDFEDLKIKKVNNISEKGREQLQISFKELIKILINEEKELNEFIELLEVWRIKLKEKREQELVSSKCLKKKN